MSSLADKLEKIDTCLWIVPSIVLLEITQPLREQRWKGTGLFVCATTKCKLTCEWDCSKNSWSLKSGLRNCSFYFLLTVSWVWKLYNEYGFELLLPHFGGRGACGSLCIRSAKLAVEAVVEFWHCVLDFHLPHFLQEVYGGVELGRHVGRLVFSLS